MSYRTDRFDERVIQLLRGGGVGFMPSDTIYGLSCQALNESAVERIYGLKKRDSNKPLIVLIAAVSQLERLGIKPSQAEPVKKYWPGPLTLICETSEAPAWLQRGTKTLAVRLPGNEKLRQLISQTGPLVSTSANSQGGEPINSAKEADNFFGDQLDFYVDAGDLSAHRPSTLVRVVGSKLKVVRHGAVKIESKRRLNDTE